jgi:hypothetical protein
LLLSQNVQDPPPEYARVICEISGFGIAQRWGPSMRFDPVDYRWNENDSLSRGGVR